MPDTRAGQDLDRAANTWVDLHDHTGSVVKDGSGNPVKVRFGNGKAVQAPPQQAAPKPGAWTLQAPPPKPAMMQGGPLRAGGQTAPPIQPMLGAGGQTALGIPGAAAEVSTSTAEGMAVDAEGNPINTGPQTPFDAPGEYEHFLKEQDQLSPEDDDEGFWQEIEKKMQDPEVMLKLKNMLARMEPRRSKIPAILGSANMPRIG